MKNLSALLLALTGVFPLFAGKGVAPENTEKPLALPKLTNPNFKVPLCGKSEAFLHRTTGQFLIGGGIVGVLGTMYCMKNDSDKLAYAAKCLASGVAGAFVLGLIGRSIARNSLNETKIENKINSDVRKLNGKINELAILKAHQLDIDSLAYYKTEKNRLSTYQTLGSVNKFLPEPYQCSSKM